jgi:HTH-type transcriptional regulator/antitoxin HigA
MNLEPIKTDKDYEAMLKWVNTQFDLSPNIDSPAGKELQTALLLIKDYEDVHYKIPNLIS